MVGARNRDGLRSRAPGQRARFGARVSPRRARPARGTPAWTDVSTAIPSRLQDAAAHGWMTPASESRRQGPMTDISDGGDTTVALDAVVIGAGFAGLYALHRLRED